MVEISQKNCQYNIFFMYLSLPQQRLPGIEERPPRPPRPLRLDPRRRLRVCQGNVILLYVIFRKQILRDKMNSM